MEKVNVKAIILKHSKFRADIIIGNDVLEKRTRIFHTLKKNISISRVVIPFICHDADQDPFDRNNYLLADFKYVSHTEQKKGRRATQKFLNVEEINVNEDI